MNTTPAPRRHQPLGQTPAVRAVDRITQPDSKRSAHPTFNSAV